MMKPESMMTLGFDPVDCEKRFAGMDDVFALCLSKYFEQNDIEKLCRAYADGNIAQASRYSHMLMGGSANLALMPLSGLYKEINLAFRTAPETAGALIEKAAGLERKFREASKLDGII